MKPRRVVALFACAALTASILAGCGGGGGGGDVDVGPAAAAPASAPLYFDGTLKPQGSAKADANAALGKILDTDDPGAKIISLIDQEGQQQPAAQQFTYQQDIAPWLGDQVGLFFTTFAGDPDGAVIVETTNPDAALAFARASSGATETTPQPQTYNGVSYQADPDEPDSVFGVVDDFLVEGSLDGFKAAADASKGDSLGDSSDYKDAIGDLPDDRLGTFYTVPKNLLAAIPGDQVSPGGRAFFQRAAGDNLDDPVAGSLSATADSLQLDFQSEGGADVETPQSTLIGAVPADAWLALGIGDLGNTVREALDQAKDAGIPGFEQAVSQIESATGSSLDELTGAIGDSVIYVKGTTEQSISGALVIQVENADLTGRLLGQLQSLLSLTGGVKPLSLPGGGTGFQYSDPTNFPRSIEIAQQADKLVIAYAGSAQEALQPGRQLQGSPAFTAAENQISSLGADLFLRLPSIFQLAESSGAKADPDYLKAKPYIAALDYLVSGSGNEDGKTAVKAVLGLN